MSKIQYEAKNFNAATLADIRRAEAIVTEYRGQGFNLTLRQLYYQMVARGFIPNNERSYKRIGNIVSSARRAGLIDWSAIEDRTRALRRVTAWNSIEEIMVAAANSYHKDLWLTQPTRVEVWIEKDALVGVIQPVCNELDVPYFSCRGYVSDSEMWAAGVRILRQARNGQRTYVLHLGDHDPSGIDMTRDIGERLGLFSGYSDFDVDRIALTMDQIRDQSPPPNPAKTTDSRYEAYIAEYGSESWELDALEPSFIADLIRDGVNAQMDHDLMNAAIDEQERDRERIRELIERAQDY